MGYDAQFDNNHTYSCARKFTYPLPKLCFFLVFKVKKLKMGQSVTGTNALRITKYI